MATQALAIRQFKDIPALRQLFSLVLVAAAVAGGAAVFMWSQKPAFTPLFATLEARDATAVTDALRAANIPSQIDPASGAVSVPAAQVHEARLKLAAQGLPKSASQGYEMIQGEQGFGTSQFIESARYQHALETELARTIASLQTVAAARVHLAIPKPSAFTRSGGSASASVLVELRGGRTLDEDQVASIVHLVASSVPDLPAESVSVIDQSGRLLTRSGGDAAMAQTREQFDYSRRVEREYTQRIEQLLAPMMGPGRVSAQVSAEHDFAVTEEARETYNPNPQALRSEQSSETRNAGSGPRGVPGATSNQPPSSAAAVPLNATSGPGAEVSAQSTQTTRNYEIDKTLSHTRQASGTLKRLSVAVLVDHLPVTDDKGVVTMTALKPEQLAQVEALVKEAVGFNAQRGDTVSVQNAAFLQPEALTPAEPLPLWQQPEFREMARNGLGALVVLILVFTVLRPTLRSLMTAPIAPPAAAALEGRIEAGTGGGAAALAMGEDRLSLGAPAAATHPYEQKLQAARSAVAADPKRVAQVVKTWVAAE